jgi:hypothetical protein
MATEINNVGIKFPDNTVQETLTDYHEFYVYNGSHWNVTNGGRCCYWTVPAGVTSIKFEILSGGGPGGASGGDYDFGVGGNGGNYTSKHLRKAAGNFAAGCGYRMCAGGTSSCSCCCRCGVNCRHGCKSFVQGSGLSNFCAQGGMGGSTNFDTVSGCYNCYLGNTQCNKGQYNAGWINCYCNSATFGGDIEFRGTSGSMYKGVSCCSHMFSVAGTPTGPFSSVHGVSGKDACTGNLACCSAHSVFPGGGGPGHVTASRNACWGSWGAGGLVKVSYS